MGITSSEFEALAAVRLRESEILARDGQFSGAYYLLGYAAECALKAVIARQFSARSMPTPAEVKGLHTHRLDELLRRAGLEAAARNRMRGDADFDRSWAWAMQWTSDARYGSSSKRAYDELHVALTDPKAGVLTWIETLSQGQAT